MFSYSVGHFNDAGSKESYPLRMQEASEPSKRRTFHVSILGDGSVEVTEDISGWRSHVWAKLCLFSLPIPVVKQTSCTLPSRFNKSQLCPRGVDLTFSLSHTNSRLISRPEGKESLLEEEELSLLAILMLVEYVTYYRG